MNCSEYQVIQICVITEIQNAVKYEKAQLCGKEVMTDFDEKFYP